MSIVKLNNRGVRSATTFGSITGLGSMTFIKKQTASSSATISFVDGTSDVVLDDTYKEYLFTFKELHPSADGGQLMVGFRDGSTAYDATKTTTCFKAYHAEDDAGQSLVYEAGNDMAQGTGVTFLSSNIDNDNDANCSGYLHLFNPASTTFVKHFIYTGVVLGATKYCYNDFVAGYANVTAAIDGVQFSMNSGDIDAGDICLYGIN